MSGETNKRLYVVTLSAEVIVVAESAEAASKVATETGVTDGRLCLGIC